MVGFTKVAVTLLALCALAEANKPEKHHHGKKPERSQMRREKKEKEGTVLVELDEGAETEMEDTHSAADYRALAAKVARMERQLVDAHSTNKDLARKLMAKKKHRSPAADDEDKSAEGEEDSEQELAAKVHKKNDDAIAKADGDGKDKDGDDKDDADSDDALSPSEKAAEAAKEEELGEAYKAGIAAGKKKCGGGGSDDDDDSKSKSSLIENDDDENFVGSSRKDGLIADKLNNAEKQLARARRMLELARKKFPEERLTEANLDALMETGASEGSGTQWGGRRRCDINTNTQCYCSTRRRGSGSWIQESDEDGADRASLVESGDKEALESLEEAANEDRAGWGGRRRCFSNNKHTDCGSEGDCLDAI